MKKSTKAIIGASVGTLAALNLAHAVFYKPPKTDWGAKPDERVDLDRMQKNLSRAIQYKTISNADESKTDWTEFDRFHAFLDEAYPLIAQTLACSVRRRRRGKGSRRAGQSALSLERDKPGSGTDRAALPSGRCTGHARHGGRLGTSGV